MEKYMKTYLEMLYCLDRFSWLINHGATQVYLDMLEIKSPTFVRLKKLKPTTRAVVKLAYFDKLIECGGMHVDLSGLKEIVSKSHISSFWTKINGIDTLVVKNENNYFNKRKLNKISLGKETWEKMDALTWFGCFKLFGLASCFNETLLIETTDEDKNNYGGEVIKVSCSKNSFYINESIVKSCLSVYIPEKLEYKLKFLSQ